MILVELLLPIRIHHLLTLLLSSINIHLFHQPLAILFIPNTYTNTSKNMPNDDSIEKKQSNLKSNETTLAPAILVYHESARSIVFRDDLRRQRKMQNKQSKEKDTNDSKMVPFNDDMKNITVTNSLSPVIKPLPSLKLGPQDDFLPLMQSQSNESNDESIDFSDSSSSNKCVFTKEEKEVIQLLEREQATVKTIRNADWTDFLNRFVSSKDVINDDQISSFYTSTTLL